MLSALSLLLLGCFVTIGQSALPHGIKPCKDDANLNECVMKTANEVIPKFAKGDPKYKVPPMDPLHIERIEVTESPGKSIALNLTLENLDIHGLSKCVFLKSEMDTAKRTAKYHASVDEIKLLGDYEMNGKFLVVPITGKGKATVIIKEPKMSFDFDYTETKKNGKVYLVLGKTKLEYDPKKIEVNLENLFNGDKALGASTNAMLNDNWEELNKQLGPGIAEAIRLYVTSLLAGILKMTPKNEIFL